MKIVIPGGSGQVGTVLARHIWLQAATATIYSHRYDAPNDETTGIVGAERHKGPHAA